MSEFSSPLINMLFLQVNDTAVSFRLVIFEYEEQLFYTQITEKTGGGRGVSEEMGVNPLTCCVG